MPHPVAHNRPVADITIVREASNSRLKVVVLVVGDGSKDVIVDDDKRVMLWKFRRHCRRLLRRC